MGKSPDAPAVRFHEASRRLANTLSLLRSGGLDLSVADAEALRQCCRDVAPELVAGRAGQPRVEVRWNRSWGVKATSYHEAAAALVCDAARRKACGGFPDVGMGVITDLLMNLELERALVPVPMAGRLDAVPWSRPRPPKRWRVIFADERGVPLGEDKFAAMRKRGELRQSPDSTTKRVRLDLRDVRRFVPDFDDATA